MTALRNKRNAPSAVGDLSASTSTVCSLDVDLEHGGSALLRNKTYCGVDHMSLSKMKSSTLNFGTFKRPDEEIFEISYWFQRAAEQGDPFAYFSLGRRYENGEGVQQSYSEALAWYKKAADTNLVQAFYQIGMLYAEGHGVTQDFKEAVAWTRRAAKAGYPAASYNLGVAYATGQGVQKDVVESYKWFSLSVYLTEKFGGIQYESFTPSAQFSAAAAKLALKQVASLMSKSEIIKADAAVKKWLDIHRE